MPDRNRKPGGSSPEFEVAYYTKELGKTLQRQMLEKQLARLSEGSKSSRRHGEEATPAADTVTPQEDRAG